MPEKVEADLGAHNAEGFEEYVNGMLGVCLPTDAPLYVRFWRLVDREGVGLTGWVLELDLFLHELKFYVRIDRPGLPVKLLVEEPDGSKELLGEWTRE